MRFSHTQLFNQSLQSFSRLQSDNLRAQEQISSGKKILKPSDDPISATRIQQLREEIGQNSQFQNNIRTIENRLSTQEVQIGSAETSLIRLRELTIQAGNAALNQQDRRAIAAEVEVLRDQLLSIANSRDAAGKYVFSGYQSDNAPYQKLPDGTISYLGDDGQQALKISATTSLSLTTRARDVFTDVPGLEPSFVVRADPNNQANPPAIIEHQGVVDQLAFDTSFDSYPDDYEIVFADPADQFDVIRRSDGAVEMTAVPYSSGDSIEVNGRQFAIEGIVEPGDRFVIESRNSESVFETADKLLMGLQGIGDIGPDSVVLSELVGRTIEGLDNSLDKMLQARTSIGARLNVAESTRNIHQDVELLNQQTLSDLEDVDYEEVISRLSYQSFVLEAAQQSFARIANLSLFNFLR